MHIGNFAMYGRKALMIDYPASTFLDDRNLPGSSWVMHYMKRRIFGFEMTKAGLGGGWKELARLATAGSTPTSRTTPSTTWGG